MFITPSPPILDFLYCLPFSEGVVGSSQQCWWLPRLHLRLPGSQVVPRTHLCSMPAITEVLDFEGSGAPPLFMPSLTSAINFTNQTKWFFLSHWTQTVCFCPRADVLVQDYWLSGFTCVVGGHSPQAGIRAPPSACEAGLVPLQATHTGQEETSPSCLLPGFG